MSTCAICNAPLVQPTDGTKEPPRPYCPRCEVHLSESRDDVIHWDSCSEPTDAPEPKMVRRYKRRIMDMGGANLDPDAGEDEDAP